MSENKDLEQSEQTYPFLLDYLPDEFRQKAENELHETPENRSHSLEKLKLLIKNDDALKDIGFHEDFMVQFLRQSKFDVNKALQRFQTFIKFRKENGSYFKNIELEDYLTPDYQFFTPLPWRCRDGCTVTLLEYSKWEPSGIQMIDIARVHLIVHHQAMRIPASQINGFKMIIDWKDASLNKLFLSHPKFLLTAYKASLICTPVRMKEIHLVNGGLALQLMWAFFKPILPAKIKNRIFFHSSPADLLKHFPKHVLPTQYGGDLENYYMEDWFKEANEQTKSWSLAGQSNIF